MLIPDMQPVEDVGSRSPAPAPRNLETEFGIRAADYIDARAAPDTPPARLDPRSGRAFWGARGRLAGRQAGGEVGHDRGCLIFYQQGMHLSQYLKRRASGIGSASEAATDTRNPL